MTDAALMDADCIHGKAWYDCEECGQPCDAAIRPFPDSTEVRCDKTATHADNHAGALKDYAYPGSVTTIHWTENDRRNFHGGWPGSCQGACTLPKGHHGDHAN